MKPSEDLFAEDQHVEIIDLSTNNANQHPLPPPRTQISPDQLRRRRLAQWGGILIIGALCLLLLLHSIPNPRTAFFSGIFGPTPTPTTSTLTGSNVSLFYINATPSWGVLSIDGKPVAHPPMLKNNPPLHLAPGSHHFLWQAAPFQPRSCMLSVPQRFTDSCSATEVGNAPDAQLAWVLSFPNSLLTLSLVQQKALTAQIQHALDALSTSDIVRPGEHFAGVSSSNPTSGAPIDTARQPMKGTLHLTLGSDSTGSCAGGFCMLNGQDCHLLCALDYGASWHTLAVVQVSWTYTTLDGHIVGTHLDDELGGAAILEHLFALNISWDGQQWQVQTEREYFGNPIACLSPSSDLSAISNASSTQPVQAFQWNFLSSPNSASGCLIVATRAETQPLLFLHRFGVDLAVNVPAQKYNPNLPRADAYEMQLANQLLAQFQTSQ